MKYIYKIAFWQSTIYLKCLLVSLCTLMKTINFHHILTNISNLFWQFINTPPDLHVQTISSYPGWRFPKGNAPSNSLDPRYGQKYRTISSFDLTLISNICSKISYSLGLLVQINKRNLFKLILYCPFFVICIIFSISLARYFVLNRYCEASLFTRVNLHMSVIWYFPPCCFFYVI